jgi:hypothetical protein
VVCQQVARDQLSNGRWLLLPHAPAPARPPFFFSAHPPRAQAHLNYKAFSHPPEPSTQRSLVPPPPPFQNNKSTDEENGGSSAGALSLRTPPARPLILATSRRSQNNIVILLRKKQSYITFARVVPESVSSSRSSHLYQTPHGPLILRGPSPALADARRSTDNSPICPTASTPAPLINYITSQNRGSSPLLRTERKASLAHTSSLQRQLCLRTSIYLSSFFSPQLNRPPSID